MEIDKEKSRFTYIGAQTSGQYFLHFFAGKLVYDYTDNGVLLNSDNEMLSGAVGIRLGHNKNFSIALGGTEQRIIETSGDISVSDNKDSGEFVQISAGKYTGRHNYEFLASYSGIDDFVWSRFRYKTEIVSEVKAGGEFFWMGNSKADSAGAGIILDRNTKWINYGIKFGLKQTTNDTESTYAGLELYIPL